MSYYFYFSYIEKNVFIPLEEKNIVCDIIELNKEKEYSNSHKEYSKPLRELSNLSGLLRKSKNIL